MSHYNVNASVSKTLIQHLIRFVASSGDVDETTTQILLKILSPRVTGTGPADADGVMQATEKIVGPYELQDSIFLRYPVRLSSVQDCVSHPPRVVRHWSRSLA